MIDWNVRLGDILVMITLFGSVLVYAFRAGGVNQMVTSLKEDIQEVKDSQKGMAQVLTAVAVQQSRLDAVDRRLALIDEHMDEMRHGRGFIQDQGHSR